MLPQASDIGIFQRLIELSVETHRLSDREAGLAVYEADGYRWLCSPPGAVQCAMELAEPRALVLPNQAAMLLAAVLPERCEQVLDLGTGGGGFVRALRSRDAAPTFTCIDSDPAMVAIARRYFELPGDQPVHVEDAGAFLRRDGGLYDLALCDLFRGRESPPDLETVEFFESLKARLNTSSAVAINTLPSHADQLKAIVRCARRSFPGLAVLSFHDVGNVVLFLSPTTLPQRESWQSRLQGSPWAGEAFLEGAIERLVYV